MFEHTCSRDLLQHFEPVLVMDVYMDDNSLILVGGEEMDLVYNHKELQVE